MVGKPQPEVAPGVLLTKPPTVSAALRRYGRWLDACGGLCSWAIDEGLYACDLVVPTTSRRPENTTPSAGLLLELERRSREELAKILGRFQAGLVAVRARGRFGSGRLPGLTTGRGGVDGPLILEGAPWDDGVMGRRGWSTSEQTLFERSSQDLCSNSSRAPARGVLFAAMRLGSG
jgi:hypothetical protein